MTSTVVIMIIVGIIICVASFFVSEKISDKGNAVHSKLMAVEEDYEFSERELRIIRRKIEDVIANQAKDILYETNESLSNMANEKTMALGDYAVAVCDQIETNHKEVMFLYSMLDDKQKEIMKTVELVNDTKKDTKDILNEIKSVEQKHTNPNIVSKKESALDQLTALSQSKNNNNNNKTQNLNINERLQDAEIENRVNNEKETQKEDNIPVTDEVYQEKRQNEEETDSFIGESIEDFENDEDVFSEIDQTDIDFDEVLETEFKENENSNDIILQMHRNGNSILSIAKELGLGVGEVKLVIDLYQGE